MASNFRPAYCRSTRSKLAVAWVALLGLCTTTELSAQTRMVHRDRDRIVDGDGRPVELRGVNLGGWLLWEPWIWEGHLLASESKLSNRLESAVGPAAMAQFRQQVYENFITEADMQRISGLGFNVVRVPMNHTIFEGSAPGWQILDRLISWADRYHVYVVLDLHAAPGGQARVFTADSDTGALWDSASDQAATVALWKSIAQHFRDQRMVAGYDILNEPDPRNGADLADLDRKIVAAIREVDPAHMVIVEGGKFASDFSMFSEPLTPNQAYSFHMYPKKNNDNRAEKLAEYRQISAAQHVPMWCGEFGENTYEMIESTVAQFSNPVNQVDGWAFWTWKRGPTSNPTLNTMEFSPAWKHVVERDSSPLALGKPSGPETMQAMRQFIESIQLSHTRPDEKMISILTSHLRK